MIIVPDFHLIIEERFLFPIKFEKPIIIVEMQY